MTGIRSVQRAAGHMRNLKHFSDNAISATASSKNCGFDFAASSMIQRVTHRNARSDGMRHTMLRAKNSADMGATTPAGDNHATLTRRWGA